MSKTARQAPAEVTRIVPWPAAGVPATSVRSPGATLERATRAAAMSAMRVALRPRGAGIGAGDDAECRGQAPRPLPHDQEAGRTNAP